jgi:hypothetical protein
MRVDKICIGLALVAVVSCRHRINGRKWANCSVRSEGRSVGCSGRSLDARHAGSASGLPPWPRIQRLAEGSDHRNLATKLQALHDAVRDCLKILPDVGLRDPRMRALSDDQLLQRMRAATLW